MRKVIIFIGLMSLILAGEILPAAAQESEAVITLERTACFGFCPVYTLTIYADGTVVYAGENHVEVTGTQTAQIDPEKVTQLVEGFEAAGYFEWDDEYTDMTITDQSYVITSVTRDGETKHINRYGGDFSAPIALAYLENWIDTAVNSEQWTGIAPNIPYFFNASAPVITLDRGACAETACPAYSLTLYDDGTVIYMGYEGVEEIGFQTTQIEAEAVTALVEKMIADGYLNWAAEYTADTDQPTVTAVSLLHEGEIKRIVHHADAPDVPAELIALEDEIDTLANVAQWVSPDED